MKTVALIVVGLIVAFVLLQRFRRYLKHKDELKSIRSHNEFLHHKH